MFGFRVPVGETATVVVSTSPHQSLSQKAQREQSVDASLTVVVPSHLWIARVCAAVPTKGTGDQDDVYAFRLLGQSSQGRRDQGPLRASQASARLAYRRIVVPKALKLSPPADRKAIFQWQQV